VQTADVEDRRRRSAVGPVFSPAVAGAALSALAMLVRLHPTYTPLRGLSAIRIPPWPRLAAVIAMVAAAVLAGAAFAHGWPGPPAGKPPRLQADRPAAAVGRDADALALAALFELLREAPSKPQDLRHAAGAGARRDWHSRSARRQRSAAAPRFSPARGTPTIYRGPLLQALPAAAAPDPDLAGAWFCDLRARRRGDGGICVVPHPPEDTLAAATASGRSAGRPRVAPRSSSARRPHPLR
jgi:hypothetical protein